MQMSQQLVDLPAPIAVGEVFQLPISELKVEQRISAFIGARRLRRVSHIAAREEIGKRWVMLPEPKNRCDPFRTRKKGIFVDGHAPEQDMSTATGASKRRLVS